MRGQRIFEPDHDIGVVPPRLEIAVGIVGRQAVDKRVQQFLLKSPRDLRVINKFMSGFGKSTHFRMKAQQARAPPRTIAAPDHQAAG